MVGYPRVLVVEDEAPLRMLLDLELSDRGYDALIVGGAGSALQALEEERLDALVTNIDLGETLTGFDIARRARARNPTLPVLYVTGGEAHRYEAEKVDGSVLLPKPYVAGDVIDAVETMLKANGARPAGVIRR
jgi:DNA-binding response OmpR family regulator